MWWIMILKLSWNWNGDGSSQEDGFFWLGPPLPPPLVPHDEDFTPLATHTLSFLSTTVAQSDTVSLGEDRPPLTYQEERKSKTNKLIWFVNTRPLCDDRRVLWDFCSRQIRCASSRPPMGRRPRPPVAILALFISSSPNLWKWNLWRGFCTQRNKKKSFTTIHRSRPVSNAPPGAPSAV